MAVLPKPCVLGSRDTTLSLTVEERLSFLLSGQGSILELPVQVVQSVMLGEESVHPEISTCPFQSVVFWSTLWSFLTPGCLSILHQVPPASDARVFYSFLPTF